MWRRKICKELGKELWDDEFEVRPSPRERGDESKRKSKSARRSHSKSIIQCRSKTIISKSEKIKNSSRTSINVRFVCKILLQSCALSTRNSQIKKEATEMKKALVANDGPLIHSVTLTPKSMTSN